MATQSGGAQRGRLRLGAGLMVASMLAFATLDGLRKAMADSVPVGVIVATRYLVFVLVAAVWLVRDREERPLRTAHPVLQPLRAVVMLAEATVFVLALKSASLADANAVFALAPVAGVVLAVMLLGERAGTLVWLASAVSLLGILVMLRPGGGSHPAGLWLALLSAVLYALYGVLTSKVSDSDSPRTSFLYMTLVGAVAVAVFAAVQLPQWHRPSPRDSALLLAAALSAAAGQYLLIRAYAAAPAAALQPYTYFLFAWSVPISTLCFGSPPGPAALAGTALVIGSGVALFTLVDRTSPGRLTHESSAD